jgi:hypothetical protein
MCQQFTAAKRANAPISNGSAPNNKGSVLRVEKKKKKRANML